MNNLIECFNELATDLESNRLREDNTQMHFFDRRVVLELEGVFLLLDVSFDLVMYKGTVGSICITQILSRGKVIKLDKADEDRVYIILRNTIKHKS